MLPLPHPIYPIYPIYTVHTRTLHTLHSTEQNAPPSASTVHSDRDEPAGRPEDLLLAPLPGRPVAGQAGLRERRRRRRNFPDEGLRPHLPQLRGQVHAAVHVRRQHGVRPRDRRQQHLLPAGIVSTNFIWVIY